MRTGTYCDRCDLLVGLPGLHVIKVVDGADRDHTEVCVRPREPEAALHVRKHLRVAGREPRRERIGERAGERLRVVTEDVRRELEDIGARRGRDAKIGKAIEHVCDRLIDDRGDRAEVVGRGVTDDEQQVHRLRQARP